jgi:transposase
MGQVTTIGLDIAKSVFQVHGARRLATIPGIGNINATTLLAAVGDASAFAKGRAIWRLGSD